MLPFEQVLVRVEKSIIAQLGNAIFAQIIMVERINLIAILEIIPVLHNHFHNIFRLFDVLPNFPFTTSETKCDY